MWPFSVPPLWLFPLYWAADCYCSYSIRQDIKFWVVMTFCANKRLLACCAAAIFKPNQTTTRSKLLEGFRVGAVAYCATLCKVEPTYTIFTSDLTINRLLTILLDTLRQGYPWLRYLGSKKKQYLYSLRYFHFIRWWEDAQLTHPWSSNKKYRL